MSRDRCEETTCELWSRGCTDQDVFCTLNNDADLPAVEVLTEFLASFSINDLVDILKLHNIPTPEECGYVSADVEWTWKYNTEYPIWIVPSVVQQTKEVKGLGSE